MKYRGLFYLIFCLNLFNALILPVGRVRLIGIQKVLRNKPANCFAPLPVLLHCSKQQNDHDDINIQSSNATQSSNSTLDKLEISETNSTVPIPVVDEVSVAIANKDAQLREEVKKLEDILRTERSNLSKVKDKISESGKTGFYIIQAQVNDYARKRNTEQKLQVERNKRNFIEKILPWIDEFRKAQYVIPAIEEKTHTMHRSFSSLLKHVLAVFEKYGYREFIPVPGDELNDQQHEIIEIRNSTTTTSDETQSEGSCVPVVLEVHRPGLSNKDGDIIRKAQVVIAQPEIPVVIISEDQIPASPLEKDRDTGNQEDTTSDQRSTESNNSNNNSKHSIGDDSI